MGVSSRHGTIAIGIQSAKGTPLANPQRKLWLREAPTLMPVRERGRVPRTDGGRDQGRAFTSAMRVEGDIPVHMHPDANAILFYAALGAVAHSGAANFTHTITPANDLPWLTIWRMAGLTVLERYVDCKVVGLSLESAAGGLVGLTLSVVGIKSTFEASDTVLAVTTSDEYVHMEAFGEHKVAGGAVPVDSVSYEIANGTSPWQADDYFPTDIDPGGREISLNFGARFQSPTIEPKYRETFYGSDAGTNMSAADVPKAWQITYTRDANTSVKIECPEITYAAVPVQPDPSGDPIGMAVSANVEKPAGATAITTVTVKDQNATF